MVADGAIMRRLYRAVLRTYDEDDANAEIECDWQRDARGQESISRQLFLDAIFELAGDLRDLHLG